jgi:hypothetical protein
MKTPVKLIPLKCTHCDSPVPAEKDEVVWVCETCGQGLQLDHEVGLAPLEIHYATQDANTRSKGLPYWVAKGRVSVERREVYPGKELAETNWQPFWNDEHTFIIPAYTCKLLDAVRLGDHYLDDPPALQDGPPSQFQKITVDKNDAKSLAEFIVITHEVVRTDNLKDIDFKLELEEMTLWIIPVVLDG